MKRLSLVIVGLLLALSVSACTPGADADSKPSPDDLKNVTAVKSAFDNLITNIRTETALNKKAGLGDEDGKWTESLKSMHSGLTQDEAMGIVATFSGLLRQVPTMKIEIDPAFITVRGLDASFSSGDIAMTFSGKTNRGDGTGNVIEWKRLSGTWKITSIDGSVRKPRS